MKNINWPAIIFCIIFAPILIIGLPFYFIYWLCGGMKPERCNICGELLEEPWDAKRQFCKGRPQHRQ